MRLAFIDYAFTVGMDLPVLWHCLGSTCVVRLSGLYLCCGVVLAQSVLWRCLSSICVVRLFGLCLCCEVVWALPVL